MAENGEDVNNIVESLTKSPSVLKSDKKITPSQEDQYDLRWPASQDRDLTQTITEESSHNSHLTTTKSNAGDGESGQEHELNQNQCQEVKEIQQKKTFYPEQNDTSLNNDLRPSSFGHKRKKNFRTTLQRLKLKRAHPHGLQNTSYWNVFSDEIILGIFSCLTKRTLCVCAKVCRKWRRLAYDESLWQSMDLTGVNIKEDVLQHLFMRGVVVMRLAWLEVFSSEKSETSNENTECNQDESYDVQYLDASSCSIKENNLTQTLLKCKNLKKLSLESCRVSTGILRALGQCKQLSVLNLCMCSQITEKGLDSLATGCQRVTELNLGWTNLSSESVTTVVQKFPLLVKLNLSGCRQTLRDQAVADLLVTCRSLRCLDVSDCIEISEQSVQSIVKHARMEHLALSRCYGITPRCLGTLSSLKSLRSLQMFGFLTDPVLSRLKTALVGIQINGNMFSTIARPGEEKIKQTIWGEKCLGQNYSCV